MAATERSKAEDIYADHEPFVPEREDPLLQRAVPVTRDV
jgi:hypothetical protein